MVDFLNEFESDEEKARHLENLLIEVARGGYRDDSTQYIALRTYFAQNTTYKPLLPAFTRECRTLKQFWGFIQPKFPSYRERESFISHEFCALFDHLEGVGVTPSDFHITDGLRSYDEQGVNEAWTKALDRRSTDPEGAITAARTLIETVCKHILDDLKVEYDRNLDMSELYKLTAKELNLAPDQHSEQIFKQILKGCSSVVNGLGTLRNRLGDAHGIGKKPVKPSDRHALLAVNLAGSMAVFLVQTWQHLSKS
ncbi:abortive infection family protein [Pantoea dispersa]|uniref:abortive infection family protein n=1 Tax=Pantoea dispersa TaxID=59814 RepID=UPI001BAD101F|nr:abortive infection family protein [Pantoea dispersa]MBS0905958.1 abortive infection family protein [Pantoea dispersa]